MFKNTQDIYLSKFLSWLLRHGANKEGFILSPEGYLEVDKILQHKNLKGKYNLSDVERVVNNNNKQRFKFRWNAQNNTLELKANQGHSINVEDIDLMQILEPKYETIVHGTYYYCWPKIKTEGLSRMKRLHIHLSKSILGTNIVGGLRKNIQIYVFIDLAKALANGIKFYESENGVILTPGNEKGFLTPKYFLKVIDVKTGFPSDIQAQDLTTTFAKYGTVSLNKLTKRFATLTFVKDDDAKAAVRDSKKVNIDGKFLTVHNYRHKSEYVALNTQKNDQSLTQKRSETVNPFCITLSGEFPQQVNNLLAAVRLTQEEVNRLSCLYSHLEQVLQVLWPGCKAIPFGSITTGLGIKSSDADCFISIPNRLRYYNENHVDKAKRVLRAYPDIFAEIIPIPHANTPIIKFYHLPSETNCDISFKTPLGTQNSMLIRFLLQSDSRLIPMAVIIKYWAKVHGLTGTRKLSNYALLMMIVFYLQQHPISLLPSIRWLQQNPADEYIIDFWNAGFMNSHERLPRSSNTCSVLELLGGFFQFYSNFNFQDTVVCPYLGKPVNKCIFADSAALPFEFVRYKYNVEMKNVMPIKFLTPMCVQDPIEHNHNVASFVCYKLAKNIQEFFKFAAHVYEEGKHRGCQNFLKTILLQKPKIVQLKPIKYNYKFYLKMDDVINIADRDWNNAIKESIVIVFEDMLKITLHQMEAGMQLTELQKEKAKFVGTVTHAVWNRQQYMRVQHALEVDFVQRESKITDEIIKADKTVIELKFQMMVIFHNNLKFDFSLKYLNGNMGHFKQFGKFFLNTVPRWLRKLNQSCLNTSVVRNTVDAETIRTITNTNDSVDDDTSTEIS